MDSVDICAATSRRDNKRRVNKKSRDWHKRLHLRKTAVQPPTMQSGDKRGPKKIAGEWEQSTVWPSSKKPPEEAQQQQHGRRGGAKDGGNPLRFTCSQCGDNLEYVPKDLVKHFEESHRGSPPVFSCHTCAFTTHEFSYLQVHLLSHKDTFSSCSICNDNVQRTWPEFSAHLTACHCQNGKYSCEMCQKFSTGDVRVFLEHMCAHTLGLEGAKELSLHIKGGKNKFGPKTTTLRCQHCGYEASQKWLITKHVKAVHVCQNQRKRKTKEEVCPLAMKPNDPLPKMKPRLTRSAVKEMCWLTQDCLSLPGREFLDKYCHLSDPQTTLEETQQFLMKSVTGETGDQKWTKALKTVLSNVPQDMNLHPKSENGIVSNSSDLTVLTVKNKITVAQNGATYAKRLKMMTSSDSISPEGAPDDARRVTENGCPSNSSDHTPSPQTETKLSKDASAPAQSENRENQELKSDQEIEEKTEESMHGDGISSELTKESEEQTSVRKAVPKNKRRRRKGKARSDKRSSGLALKIVLKKNPVKEKQWVSQGGLTEECQGPPSNQTTLEETTPILQNTEEHQKKWTKADAITSSPQSTPGEELQLMASDKDVDGNMAVEGSPRQDVAEKSQELADESISAFEALQSDCPTAAAETEVEPSPENEQLQTSGGSHVSEEEMSSPADGATPRSTPDSQPVITVQGNSEDLNLEGARDGEAPADSFPDLLGDFHQEPSPAAGRQWQPLPKNLERTLKLVAISPSQLVKRPAGDQPVVVLNHPDADIPEVARIMEVINRYRGDVQKVVLSRRTANALSAIYDPAGDAKNPVQERFMLKLKLRRLSRKKYEVVDAVAPSRDAASTKFRCWFCGRLFVCQETWMVHRQRHLMEWKQPNSCENSS